MTEHGASEGQPVRLSFASIFAADVPALSGFYERVFSLTEMTSLNSEHFRGLWIGGTILGFSAHSAYQLLELPRPVDESGVRTFLTFEVDDRSQVAALLNTAVATGASVVQQPHHTYYGAWQAVGLDPEGNAFRINYLPAVGAEA